MCKNVQNSAFSADIFMKFGTKVLNWALNDSRNFYYKQTLDGEIIEFFHRGPVFYAAPCIYIYIYTGSAKKDPLAKLRYYDNR